MTLFFVRACCGQCVPRKRINIICAFAIMSALFTLAIIIISNTRMPHEEYLEQRLITMQERMRYLNSLYRTRQEELLAMQMRYLHGKSNCSHEQLPSQVYGITHPTVQTEIKALLRNISGTRTAAGLNVSCLQPIHMPNAHQLMPYLMQDPFSLRPAFHMKGNRGPVDVVLGIPSVRRDKESYLMITLVHLIRGLTEEELNSTLIVVLIGETDLTYVLQTARQIESLFFQQLDSGLLEVLAPAHSYYPDLDALPATLGDPMKRVKWRTKQNLDYIYLMTYAQGKGSYYLMLEDDIVTKRYYMKKIKKFILDTSLSSPQWIILEFCNIGAIGKLFRSSDLLHFVTYVQLFYNNLPIDWLMESYLADKVCSMEKTSKQCAKIKLTIRPKYTSSLFQHIGLHSSLKGKIQKLKDWRFGTVPSFYPHVNPAVQDIRCDIKEYSRHTIEKAYKGTTYFWGYTPKKGDIVEFIFEKPLLLKRFLLRSGSVEQISDKFYDTAVEVLPATADPSVNGSYIQVGTFDKFGLAEGTIEQSIGQVSSLRLRVQKDSTFWVLLNEICLEPSEDENR